MSWGENYSNILGTKLLIMLVVSAKSREEFARRFKD